MWGRYETHALLLLARLGGNCSKPTIFFADVPITIWQQCVGLGPVVVRNATWMPQENPKPHVCLLDVVRQCICQPKLYVVQRNRDPVVLGSRPGEGDKSLRLLRHLKHDTHTHTAHKSAHH